MKTLKKIYDSISNLHYVYVDGKLTEHIFCYFSHRCDREYSWDCINLELPLKIRKNKHEKK